MKQGRGYDLTYGETGLEKGDYLFLQRFLDATKSNLFFAKGVIMVEGDAENLLLPVLADILGYPLEKYGISIVNVGSTAFLRYSGIFIRKDGSTIGIPVSVITDCDVKPCYKESAETGIEEFNSKVKESSDVVKEKEKKYSVGTVKGFIAPGWTLEYCLAMSCLSERFHRAIYYGKKIKNSDTYSLIIKKIEKADKEAEKEYKQWSLMSREERAFGKTEDDLFELFPEYFMKKGELKEKNQGNRNFFIEPIGGRKIEIDTVHGVKGETHDATLYLETEKNRSSDIRRILPYWGIGKKGSQAISEYSRKCVYAGMSRPRKLLCLAVRAETYEEGKKIFQTSERN